MCFVFLFYQIPVILVRELSSQSHNVYVHKLQFEKYGTCETMNRRFMRLRKQISPYFGIEVA